jgi:NitT/TauT family transport system ATP-binding protein
MSGSMTAPTHAAIHAAGIAKHYDAGARSVAALEGIDLVVAEGEFVALLGPSGCGKSTLLNLVAGFEQPSAGAISVFAQPVRKPGPSRAVVFQEPALFPWLSVWENVVFGPKLAGKPKAEYVDAAREFIASVGLAGFEEHLPEQLSGGMRQRVGIARALLMRPQVLLMDEPFGALDAQTRLQMQELLLSLWEKYRKTILFITHDIDEAVLLADTIYVMSARPGRLQARLEVDLPRPRSVDLLTDNRFNALRREIFQLIRGV